MDKTSVEITFTLANEKRVCLEVSIEVKNLLEQTDRQIRSQRRQDRRRHTEYIDGQTNTTTALPQEDIADLLFRMDSYQQLYVAINKLTKIQQRRLYMYYFLGLTNRQIAAIDGVNHSSVVRLIQQAVKALRKYIIK